ncbi:MAG: GNAT family N-acetyltransferase [Pseudomonadota bacterium]
MTPHAAQASVTAMTTATIRTTISADMPAITQLCWDYRDVLIARAGARRGVVEVAYASEGYAALLTDLPRIHARPLGDILVAEIDGDVLGCAMYYPFSEGVTEMKRVYVDPRARGSGAGRALVQAGIDHARADGYARMVIDTITPLHEAIALYQSLGFAPCAPFYEPDPAFADVLRFFDLSLQTASHDSR